MTTVAWLAPGQGAERPAMGRDVAAHHPAARTLLDATDDALHSTALVQPRLTAVALGAAAVLREAGVPCHVVAGHSVGELAAWSVAGGVGAGAVVELARARGEAMQRAAEAQPGGMWAMAPSEVPDPLPSGLVVAVENPGQTVLSGVGPAPRGATAVPTSGAWHSRAMAAARECWQGALRAVPGRPLELGIVSNHDGQVVKDDARFRDHLVRQLTHPVRFTAVLRTLASLGVSDVVTLGPGKQLAHWVHDGLPEVRLHRTDRASDLDATIRALS